MAKKPKASIRSAYRRLGPYLARRRRAAFFIVLLGALSAVGARSTIVLVQPLIDRLELDPETAPEAGLEEATASRLTELLDNYLEPWLHGLGQWGMADGISEVIALVSLMVVLAIVFSFTQYWFLRFSRMLAVLMITDLRQDMADHVTKLGMGFHSERRLGDLVSRMTVDVSASLRILSLMVEEIVQAPVAVMVALAIAWGAEPVATIGMLIFLPLVALPVAKIGPRIRRRARATQDKLGDSTQRITQVLSGIRVVKAFRMEQRESDEFRDVNKGFVEQSDHMIRAQAQSLATTNFFANGGVGIVLGVLVMVHLVLVSNGSNGIFTKVSSMMTFIMAIATVFAYTKTLTRAMAAIYASLGSIDRVFYVFDQEAEVKDLPHAKSFDGLKKSIRFEHVNFSYPDSPEQALFDFDMEVQAGERIALVGLSGAGKSTVLDLVARFYDVSAGAILVDGQDLREIKHGDWLDRLAVVQQSPFLFQASIRENILYGRPSATEEQLLEACRAANLSETLEQLPDGLDTQVGDSGSRLSGGQAQRVTIARALLKNADVLLLDEATSALDSASESKVQEALENLMEGRTTFVIAHRLGTIRGADRILVLEEGRVIEQGTHAELLKLGGSYANMWELQVGAPA
ncbi:MAG: ABC transporter ATP-binding protein [Planctomycetes bacterium]|nr:ABC transporter ATP-binding protein [Planctomycetota bacterium]MCP4770409.1 ABC transporter ATP-binding protein [Planctomycetota bacterium]MCP4860499.1 ABC transporter ATP-binding protein [Planctomycetota bacterium]